MSNPKAAPKTKRNTTKKATGEPLQSDTVKGNTSVTPVAKQATNVDKKATEQVKKPTVASLQKEVENLTQQLVYANQLVVSLDKRLIDQYDELRLSTERFNTLYNTPLSVIIYQRFTDWLYKIRENFRGYFG